jgi:hypothetical protein
VKTRNLRPRSRRHRFAELDGRTAEAKLFEAFKADLLDHLGHEPNIVQTSIIERCCWVRIRLALLDTKMADGNLTANDSHVYLAWANTLARLLARLASSRPPRRSPTRWRHCGRTSTRPEAAALPMLPMPHKTAAEAQIKLRGTPNGAGRYGTTSAPLRAPAACF